MYQAVPFPLLTDGTVAASRISPIWLTLAPGQEKAARLARATVDPRPVDLVFFSHNEKGPRLGSHQPVAALGFWVEP